MPPINLGNIVGLLPGTAAPAKTYILWSHILNNSFPDERVLKRYNTLTTSWEAIDAGENFFLPPVIDYNQTIPPASPTVGDAYLIASSGATGAWAGKSNNHAVWYGHTWRFIAPKTGANVRSKGAPIDTEYVFTGGVWVSAITTLGGGAAGYVLQFQGSSWVKTILLKDTAGVNTIRLSDRVLQDASANYSLDWNNRYLRNSTQDIVLNWNTYNLFDSNTVLSHDWSGRHLFKASPSAVKVMDYNLQTLTEGNTVKLDWLNGLFKDSLGAKSGDWESRQLYRGSESLAIDYQQSFLYDNSETNSIGWNSRHLLDASNVNAIDWDNRFLQNSSGDGIVQWNIGLLYDNNPNISIDWMSRVLQNLSGVSVDWVNNQLFDTSNILSTNWENRLLYNSVGDNVADWSGTNALFELISTTNGFLPPRMTTTQKNAIAIPSEGLVIYDLTLGKLCVFGAGAIWETVTSI